MAWPKGVPNEHAATALKAYHYKPCPKCSANTYALQYRRGKLSYSAKGFRYCIDCDYAFRVETESDT